LLRYFPLVLLAGFCLELASLIWVGSQIGVLATILLVIGGGVVGMAVISNTGTSLGAAFRRSSGQGKFSTADAGVAFLRMFAGMLFFIPGFFSDIAAVLLLVPPIARYLAQRMTRDAGWTHHPGQPPPSQSGAVIEGEAIEITGELPRSDEPADRRS
jgi:UPF0716 protein FxsA